MCAVIMLSGHSGLALHMVHMTGTQGNEVSMDRNWPDLQQVWFVMTGIVKYCAKLVQRRHSFLLSETNPIFRHCHVLVLTYGLLIKY